LEWDKPIDFKILLVSNIGWTFSIVSRINDLFSFNNSFLLSAYLNKEDMVWNKKYKALAARNSFLHLAISFNNEISLSVMASHLIILEMSFFFQLDNVLLGIVDL
jgi:hypothetical protein